jgi:phosphoribosylaminoimidazolecarboxamide formyltransferase/IMP cyclohydrolase
LGKSTKLRYGENPHQEGWFYEVEGEKSDSLAIQNFQVLQGKELSYNNYLDMDGALFAISHMGDSEAGCVIVKHTNPCGAALRGNIKDAYMAAWHEGDPLAAFGGIMAVNREVDAEVAEKMTENFFEILMAPSVTEEAKEIFAKKPNIRVLVNPALQNPIPSSAKAMHKIRGGMLVEDADTIAVPPESLKAVTARKPSPAEISDLLFAWAICRSSKSNTVVAVKNKTLIASGVGQQDRKRCAELCVLKAGERMKGTVVASDAFFPFRDAVEVLIEGGAAAIIQPGGSVRDQESVEACNEAGVAMILTGIRAFRH